MFQLCRLPGLSIQPVQGMGSLPATWLDILGIFLHQSVPVWEQCWHLM